MLHGLENGQATVQVQQVVARPSLQVLQGQDDEPCETPGVAELDPDAFAAERACMPV